MTDSFDVVNSAPATNLFNGSTVTFLSESSDTINNPTLTAGNDVINVLGGNDTIYAGKGDDIIRGGSGNDFLYGQDGQDLLEGNDGNDIIYGGGNRDTLYGNDGDDIIYGDRVAPAPPPAIVSPPPSDPCDDDQDNTKHGRWGHDDADDKHHPHHATTNNAMHKTTVGGSEASWDQFSLTAFNADGSSGHVAFHDGGKWIGVVGRTDTTAKFSNELGYDPVKQASEKLIIDFELDVYKATVDLTYFYGKNSGADGNLVMGSGKKAYHVNEVLYWKAFSNGSLVDQGTFINKTAHSDVFFHIQLKGNKTFDTVEFTAGPYDNANTSKLDNGQGNYTKDSSDFGIKAITIMYREQDPTPLPPPEADTEPGNNDLIYGGAGNDIIYGEVGDDTIFGDDTSHEASFSYHPVLLGSSTFNLTPTNFSSLWSHDTVTITPLKKDGTVGELSVISKGIGVKGNTTGSSNPDAETGYDPRTHQSETLIVDFGNLVTSATFGLSQFYSAASGIDQGKNEVLFLQLFRENQIVATGRVSSDGTSPDSFLTVINHGNGQVSFSVTDVSFDEAYLSALPYDNPQTPALDGDGQGNITVDSSDFSLQYIDYTYRTESHPPGFNDTISGGAGEDTIFGNQGNDQIHGDEGNDLIFGGAGEDTVWGDSGSDRIFGNDGDDLLHGGEDQDFIWGDGGHDVLHGDSGR